MTSNFKTKLLLGAAVTALSFSVAGGAFAQAFIDEDNDGVKDAGEVTQLGATTDENGADLGDLVLNDSDILTVANGGGDDVLVVGEDTINSAAITSTTDGNTFTITTGADIDTGNAATADTVEVVVDGDITIGADLDAEDTFNLTITSATDDGSGEGGDAEDLVVDVEGLINLGAGTLTVSTADGGAVNNDATLQVTGNVTATGGIVLTGDTSVAALTLDGSGTAQTVTGDIAGTNATLINVLNESGAIFTGTIADVDTIQVGADDTSVDVTFQNSVTGTTALTLGTGTTDGNTYNAIFDTTTNEDITVASVITEGDNDDGDTTEVEVQGGGTVTFTGTIGVDTINIASSTTAVAQAAVSSDVAGAGNFTLEDNGGATFTGNIGTSEQSIGTLTLDNTNAGGADDYEFTGNIYASTLAFTTDDTTTFSTLDTTNGATDVTITVGTVTTDNPGDGVLSLTPSGEGDVAFTSTGDVGDTTNDLSNIIVGLEGQGGDVTATFGGNVYADSIDIDEDDDDLDAVVTFTGSSATVSAPIDGQQAGEGDVVVATGANVTFGAAIGTTAINEFDLQTGATANISNDLLVDFNQNEDADGIGGGGADDTTGINIDGTLNVDTTGGVVALDDATGIMALDGTLKVTGDNSFRLGSDGTIHAGWNDTSAQLIAGENVILGDVVGGANGGDDFIVGGPVAGDGADGDIYTILAQFRDTDDDADDGFNPTTDGAILDANGNLVTINDGAKLRLGVTGLSSAAARALELDGDETITYITNADAASALEAEVDAGNIVFIDTAFIDLQKNEAGTSTTAVTATLTARSVNEALEGRTTYAGAASSLVAFPGATGTLSVARGNLLTAGSGEEASEIAESLSPNVDGGASAVAFTNANLTGDIIQTSVLAAANGEETGMTAGNISQGLRAWGQVFGKTADQDERDGVDGYDADTYGVAVGIDTETLADRWIWGLAFAYADTDIESENANTTDTEIDTYQFTLYGNYDWDDATYISGQLGYAFSDNDTTRHDVGGITGLDADGDYDSDQFLARIEAGRSYEAGRNTTLTPHILANYVYYDAEDYTETGAGTANLRVDSDSLSIFELGAGVDASWLYQQADGGYLKPEVRLGVRYDLLDEEVETTSSFTGGGAAFQTDGADPAQFTVDAGVGVTYFSTTNWELTANYDFEYKEDYDAHAGYLRAAYKF